jgi:hypothetical protein
MRSKVTMAALIGGTFLAGMFVQRGFTQTEQAWVMRVDFLKAAPDKMEAAIANERDTMQRVHQELVNNGPLRYWGAYRVVPNTINHPQAPGSNDYDIMTIQIAKSQDALKNMPWMATLRKLFPEHKSVGARKLVKTDTLQLIAETSGRP